MGRALMGFGAHTRRRGAGTDGRSGRSRKMLHGIDSHDRVRLPQDVLESVREALGIRRSIRAALRRAVFITPSPRSMFPRSKNSSTTQRHAPEPAPIRLRESSLPTPLTSFVGREQERAAL